jgi:enoyl-CoA hydratase
MSPVGTIRVATYDGVTEIQLDNRAHKNAISFAMWNSILRFAKTVSTDGATRAIIVVGNETVFSAGADVQDFATERPPGNTRPYDDLVETALRALEQVPQTTIACIAGPCVGAGASLACSCDIRVAAEDAYFMVPAARLGLGYDPRGIARFVRVFGDPAVRQLLFLADRHAARAAHAQGSVHRLVPPGRVLEEGRHIARGITRHAPLTLRAAKAALNALAASEDGSKEIWNLCEKADASADYVEGLHAFQHKRRPDFQGR